MMLGGYDQPYKGNQRCQVGICMAKQCIFGEKNTKKCKLTAPKPVVQTVLTEVKDDYRGSIKYF